LREGISTETDLLFYECRLFSLSVLGKGRYSTTVECPYDGELHALTLDFDGLQLGRILDNAAAGLRSYLVEELTRDPATPRSIDFHEMVSFRVRARLGQIQHAARESFVPLVAQEIL
jgi:hypothetical protein